MGYSAGNLELSIIGFSDKAVDSINATAKSLGSLCRVIEKIQNANVASSVHKIESLFKGIAKATNAINAKNIEKLANASKSLSSIARFANLEKMDFAKVGKGFSTLSIAIQPFLDKVKAAEAGLSSLYGILQKSSGKKIQGLLGGGGKGNKRGSIFGFLRGSVTTYMMYRMGRFMANLVQAGSDYNETLNLWQVAMRNNLDIADQFVNKMQKAYGISTKTLMNAQAVFKNMIGSLGQISDATAYALSEALVQMSADYASLYNRTLESAFQNMQSMLAGQVRPIRSAGLDMTETTLFMFYQQLGGTKTMRQLNRTEKQLLSILAVYEQMGSAGALGDMTKTLNQFANQSRMMTEYWHELKTWSGLLLKDLIDQSGLLVHINALLITATEIVKAIAKSRGVGDENYLTGLFETAEATNDAVDELQGKLLDFDKFRSLEGASASPLAIDEKLLQAITGYSSKIDQAENEAQKLATSWLEIFGFTVGANGELEITDRDLSNIKNTLSAIGISLGIILGTETISAIIAFRSNIDKANIATKKLKTSTILLNTALVGGLIWSIMTAVDAFRDGDTASGILATTLGVTLLTALVATNWEFVKMIGLKLKSFFLDASKGAAKLADVLKLVESHAFGLMLGFSILTIGVSAFIGAWKDMSGLERTLSLLISLAAAATAFAIALKATHDWVGALSIAAGVAGGALFVSSTISQSIPNYEMGASDIDSGTVFRAGEFGKTEAVYTGSNGKTNVANVKQIEQAQYNALVRYHSQHRDDDRPIVVYLDGEKVYENTTAKAKSRGNVWAKV